MAWLVTGAIALLGAVAFAGYRLGDRPEQTRRNLGLEVAEGELADTGEEE